MKKCDVGGQAVIEGVMMRGQKGLATAVRKEDGEIAVDMQRTVPITKRYKFINLPIIRGGFILIDSLIQGIKSLNYSASFFEDTEPSAFEDWLRSKFKEKTNDVIVWFTMGVAFIMSMLLFLALPTGIASLFKGAGFSSFSLNIIEALIRITILVLYMVGISKLEDIYRLFQYHGAEHKTIFCYEDGKELTVENVRKYGRLHPRCGTNFLFLIMFVSIIVFAFTGWGSFLERLLLRIILIPVISGITYEIIRWLGKSENRLAKAIAKPGLELQKITTKEPDDSQIEVAIKALKAAEGIESTVNELINEGTKILDEAKIDTSRMDATLILGKVLERDRLYLLVNKDEKVNEFKEGIFFNLIKERKNKKPIKYILGETEFMGLNLYVKEGVLIPRGDTEVLVEEVLKNIGEEESLEVLDLCSGSGAIGLALAHYRKNITVEEIDYFEVPEEVTKSNIKRLNLEDRVSFYKSDLLKSSIERAKMYDIIVSNPPYIREAVIKTLMEDVKDYEPHTALSGGEDGLIFYRRIIKDSTSVIKHGGILAFEIGHDQGEEVKILMEETDYKNVRVIKDLAGHDRVVIGSYIIEK